MIEGQVAKVTRTLQLSSMTWLVIIRTENNRCATISRHLPHHFTRHDSPVVLRLDSARLRRWFETSQTRLQRDSATTFDITPTLIRCESSGTRTHLHNTDPGMPLPSGSKQSGCGFGLPLKSEQHSVDGATAPSDGPKWLGRRHRKWLIEGKEAGGTWINRISNRVVPTCPTSPTWWGRSDPTGRRHPVLMDLIASFVSFQIAGGVGRSSSGQAATPPQKIQND